MQSGKKDETREEEMGEPLPCIPHKVERRDRDVRKFERRDKLIKRFCFTNCSIQHRKIVGHASTEWPYVIVPTDYS